MISASYLRTVKARRAREVARFAEALSNAGSIRGAGEACGINYALAKSYFATIRAQFGAQAA